MDYNFALPKRNLKLLAVGFVIIVIGFCLMIGGNNTGKFDPEVFNTQRTVIAPMIVLFGFLFEIVAILWVREEKPEDNNSLVGFENGVQQTQTTDDVRACGSKETLKIE